MNTQRKLDKVRSPRVQITYDVELGGAVEKKELPLVIGVIGQFAEQSIPMRERRFMHVDKDNFNAVMEGLSPSLELQVESALPGQSGFINVDLRFKSMADFTPENLAKQIEPLRNLLEVRSKLSDLKGRALSNEKLRDRLAEILAEHADKLPQVNEGAETAVTENTADDATPENNNIPEDNNAQ
ncbi:type VI secretion system contractile sheath small subunit [Photorhabdus heterorhabditis]|uniref:type VI secretion system contractile sheath small subunit n=1 Tax=Photorhabdus heterorhabditis TaxID=880156 RepID=UPI001BD4941A|nr:type VI secretion system contractile sheath small subunit [Photorhabdus heterorhabditis]MBS9440627.1 type VI secretion system contractile sheath small subunit [Photorhabdus heterorhabditis]